MADTMHAVVTTTRLTFSEYEDAAQLPFGSSALSFCSKARKKNWKWARVTFKCGGQQWTSRKFPLDYKHGADVMYSEAFEFKEGMSVDISVAISDAEDKECCKAKGTLTIRSRKDMRASRGRAKALKLTNAKDPQSTLTIGTMYILRKEEDCDIHVIKNGLVDISDYSALTVCKQLAGARADKSTMTLLISGAELQGRALDELCNLIRSHSNLKTIILIRSLLGEDGAVRVAEAIAKSSSIKHISLLQCAVGDAGAKALAGVLAGRKILKSFAINDHNVTDEGFVALTKLLSTCKSLRLFNVLRCRFSHAGARALTLELVRGGQDVMLEAHGSDYDSPCANCAYGEREDMVQLSDTFHMAFGVACGADLMCLLFGYVVEALEELNIAPTFWKSGVIPSPLLQRAAKALPVRDLVTLDTFMSERSVSRAAVLMRVHTVRVLVLIGPPCTRKSWEELRESVLGGDRCTIKALIVNSVRMDDATVAAFFEPLLQRTPNLTALEFHKCCFASAAGLRLLRNGVPRSRGVIELVVSLCSPPGATLDAAIGAVQVHARSLEQVSLLLCDVEVRGSGGGVSAAASDSLPSMWTQERLQTAAGTVRAMRQLKWLDIRGLDAPTSLVAQHIAAALASSPQHLMMSLCAIPVGGLRATGRVGQMLAPRPYDIAVIAEAARINVRLEEVSIAAVLFDQAASDVFCDRIGAHPGIEEFALEGIFAVKEMKSIMQQLKAPLLNLSAKRLRHIAISDHHYSRSHHKEDFTEFATEVMSECVLNVRDSRVRELTCKLLPVRASSILELLRRDTRDAKHSITHIRLTGASGATPADCDPAAAVRDAKCLVGLWLGDPVTNFLMPELREAAKEFCHRRELEEFCIPHQKGIATEELLRLFTMSTMRILDLTDTELKSLPESIALMRSLEELYVDNNPLRELPVDLHRIASLRKLRTPVEGMRRPPQNVCRNGLRSIQDFFRTLERDGARESHRLKLVIVGREESGKTSLLNTLITNQSQLQAQESRTIGIDVKRWKPHGDEHPLELLVWDFAGQETYYQTHQFFLTSRALYLLVVDLKRYHADSHDSLVKFWLDSIRAKAPGSTVVMVGTHADVVSDADAMCRDMMKQIKKDDERFIAAYLKQLESEPEKNAKMMNTLGWKITAAEECRASMMVTVAGGQVFPVSNMTLSGVPEARNEIVTLAKNRDKFPQVGQSLPISYLELEDRIAGAVRDKREFVSFETYKSWAKESGMKSDEDVARATDFLRDIGIVLHYTSDDLLASVVFLNPQWLIDVMKHVVRHDIYAVASYDDRIEDEITDDEEFLDIVHDFTKFGVLRFSLLRRLWADLTLDKQMFTIMCVMMKKFEIARSVPDVRFPEREILLVPSHMPKELSDRTPITTATNGKSLFIERHYVLRGFIPSGLFERIAVRTYSISGLQLNARHELLGFSEGGKVHISLVKAGKKSPSFSISVLAWKELPENVAFDLMFSEETKRSTGFDMESRVRDLWNHIAAYCEVIEGLIEEWPGLVYDIKQLCPCCRLGNCERVHKYDITALAETKKAKASSITCPNIRGPGKTVHLDFLLPPWGAGKVRKTSSRAPHGEGDAESRSGRATAAAGGPGSGAATAIDEAGRNAASSRSNPSSDTSMRPGMMRRGSTLANITAAAEKDKQKERAGSGGSGNATAGGKEAESRYDVMLSYQWNKQPVVRHLKQRMNDSRVAVWLDLETMTGDIYRRMAQGVQNSSVFCPCITEDYCTSENCLREMQYAADLRKPIVPVRMDDSQWIDAPALICAGKKWFRMRATEEIDDDSVYDDFLRDVRSRLIKGQTIAEQQQQDHPQSQSGQRPSMIPRDSRPTMMKQDSSASIAAMRPAMPSRRFSLLVRKHKKNGWSVKTDGTV